MKKTRSFFTVLFLFTSLIIIFLIAIFDNTLLFKAADLVKNYLWLVIILLLIFLGFLSAGIISKSTKESGSLLQNGFFQLAILELFLLSAGLVFFRYYIQQPGHIIIRLQSDEIKESVNLSLQFQSADSSATDTITAPTELYNLHAGSYHIETIDQDIEFFHTDIALKPMATESLFVPVTIDVKTLAVRTEPPGAEIWIEDSLYSNTPDTVDIINKDTVLLVLKLQNYQSYIDTLSLREDIELDVISLLKLFSLRISCAYEDMEYKIYDADKRVVFASTGSRRVRLAQGNYKISYDIGEGQIKTVEISLNYNQTIEIP